MDSTPVASDFFSVGAGGGGGGTSFDTSSEVASFAGVVSSPCVAGSIGSLVVSPWSTVVRVWSCVAVGGGSLSVLPVPSWFGVGPSANRRS